jgi:hypothetical protein
MSRNNRVAERIHGYDAEFIFGIPVFSVSGNTGIGIPDHFTAPYHDILRIQ